MANSSMNRLPEGLLISLVLLVGTMSLAGLGWRFIGCFGILAYVCFRPPSTFFTNRSVLDRQLLAEHDMSFHIGVEFP